MTRVNDPAIIDDVMAVNQDYEAALVRKDVAALDRMFQNPQVVERAAVVLANRRPAGDLRVDRFDLPDDR